VIGTEAACSKRSGRTPSPNTRANAAEAAPALSTSDPAKTLSFI